ncbi:MAG: aminotransferase class IV, partial [Desulfobaccales bacterium]
MQEFVWLNDALIPLDQARVSVNDRGFQYGDGLFETIRAEAGTVYFLEEHLARLEASAGVFRLAFPTGFSWEERLNRLLAANGLERRPARVKILLSRGEVPGAGLPEASRPTLVIWAQPYAPPPPAEYAAGWPVVAFPERRSSFIGRHKSLNYLFYLAARQYALDHGAQEAIILEADGLVSEGSATSLVYLQHGKYFTPTAASALPGVTVAALARGLNRRALSLETVPTTLGQLRKAEGVWLANALM